MLRPTMRDRVCVAVFVLGWLVPVAWRGLELPVVRAVPRPVRELASISGLFTRAIPAWQAFYVQGRHGDGPWFDIDESEWFRLAPFGRRTRMHRYLDEWGARQPPQAELAAWIAARWGEAHPDRGAPHEIRFLRGLVASQGDRIGAEGWRKPLLRELPPNHVELWSTHTIAGTP